MTLIQLLVLGLMIATARFSFKFMRDRRTVSTYHVMVTLILWAAIVGPYILFR
jgi:hypothetical protein